MPRVPYAADEDLPTDYPILDDRREGLHSDITVDWWNSQGTVRTFANSPALAETHVFANVSMWTRSGLTPQEVEYVILAVGREMDSEYEWHDHVIAAHERAGLSKAEIRAIGARDTESMSPSKRALVEYAFELVREYGEVSDERHDQLATHYDDRTVVGVAMLASYYVFIQHAAAALGIPLEDEFVGWELERY